MHEKKRKRKERKDRKEKKKEKKRKGKKTRWKLTSKLGWAWSGGAITMCQVL